MAFGSYARRRWRTLGVVVVVAGATALAPLLFGRGHEPMWDANPGQLARVVVAPDATRAYGVLEDRGNVDALEAYDAQGNLAWRDVLPGGTSSVVAGSTDGEVAVATTATSNNSGADLWVWAASNGSTIAHIHLPHTATALAAGNGEVAAAVESPTDHYPVYLVDRAGGHRIVSVGASVSALAISRGAVAIGTDAGRVVLIAPNGTVVLNETLGPAITSISLDRTARFLAIARSDASSNAGARSALPTGEVLFYHLGLGCGPDAFAAGANVASIPLKPTLCWTNETGSAVRFVELTRDGRHLLALAAPVGTRSILSLYDSANGSRPLWSLLAAGVVENADAGNAAAAISPDGSSLALATDAGPILLYGISSSGGLALSWSHDAVGASSVAFATNDSAKLVTNAAYYAPDGASHLLYFDVNAQPFVYDSAAFWVGAILLELAAGATIFFVGYYRKPSG
ncbi:MAG: hypothetical protein ACYDDF_00195 [Thermoplasmatota archaeon]